MEITGWRGEWGGPRWWARLLSYAAVLGLGLGVAGPFGSFFNAPVLIRALHWTAMMLLGAAVSGGLIPPLMRLGLALRLPRLFSLLVALVISAVPLSVMAALITRLYWAQQTHRLGPADWFGQTLMVEGAAVSLWILLELALSAARSRPSTGLPDQAAPAAIEEPLPTPRGPVLALQMEDHYVRVRRAGGSSLELMPLAEAIARYGGPGLQVHRSWWVARGAVVGAERDGRNWRLRLVDGSVAPIARNRVAEARAAGLMVGEPETVGD